MSSKLGLSWVGNWLSERFLAEAFWLWAIYLSPDRSWSSVGAREGSIVHGVWLESKLISLSFILDLSWVSLLAAIPFLKMLFTSVAESGGTSHL